MVVHFVNGWEEKNEKGEDIIRLWAPYQEDVTLDFEDEHPFVGEDFQQTLAKFTFNFTTGEADMKVICEDLKVEFPVIS